MSQSGHPSSVKTLVIILLLAIVGIQGYFLWKSRGAQESSGRTQPATQVPAAQAPAPAEKNQEQTPPGTPGQAASVQVATFHHDWKNRDRVIVSFNRPVGETESSGPLASPPFDIEPAVPGEWTWAGPYLARFEASRKNAFDPSVTYTFTARPGNFLPAGEKLSGPATFFIKPEPLDIRQWSTELEPVPGKPGWYTLSGSVLFSKEIVPQQMAKALRLIDPRLGESSPVPLEFANEGDWTTYTLGFVSAPFQAEAKERTFTLVLDKDKAESKEGFRLEAPRYCAVPVAYNGVLKALAPGQYADYQKGWELKFSSKVDPDALRGKAVLEPPVEGFSLEARQGAGVLLSGNFKPGQTYTLTIPAGVAALDGSTLGKDVRLQLPVPNLRPEVRFASPGMFLPATGAGNVGLDAVNTRQATVRVDRVYRNNIFFALNYYSDSTFEEEGYSSDQLLPYLGDNIAEFKLDLQGPRNQTRTVAMDIAARVKHSEPGLYRVGVDSEGEGQSRAEKWMLITDIGVAARRGHDDLLVWAASYKDAAPLPGARVKVISSTNQVLFQGVTDVKGMWRTKGLAGLPEDKVPFMITVEKDNDYSFLHFERFKTDMTGLDVSGVEVAQAGYQAEAWGERDIYRPGETVVGVVCVRDQQLKAPQPMPVKLHWSDPQGRELAVETVKTDAQGLLSFSRTIPVQYPTGPYLVDVMLGDDPIGQYRFQVEDFKPDRISTAIRPDVERAAPGSELAFTVEGRYLFGAPAAGLASEAQVTLTPAPFSPPGREAFVFGDPEKTFEPQTILENEAPLDEEGHAVYKAAIPAGLRPPAALSAVVTARVSEAGGRGVAARVKIPVDAYLSYPGLKKLGESGLTPGQPHEFEYVVVDGQGREATAAKLVAELYVDRWQTVLRRSEDGRGYKYETKRDSRLVERREIASPGASGVVSFTPPRYGSYRLRLTDPASGAAAQLSFWAAGEGYNPWAVENPARLELVPDKTDYLPGDTARLQVRSPYPGRLLVAVESTGVHDAQVVDMPENTGVVSVPIKAGYGPNVYVTAMLARKGTDVLPGQAGRAFGTASINVGREAGRQKLDILAPDQIKPETSLTVIAKADPGAVVTLAAVDEGILQLIAQKTPDPWASFYAKRALEVESFDTWAMLLPELKLQARKSPAGGDEDMGRFLRTESPQGEKSVAFWSGPLKADAQGRVQWTINVPRFQGALRIMAVAVSGNRFGSAQHTTRVKSPLVLLPTFPRFAQIGEAMRLPVTLRNDTGSDGSFKLAMEATGPMSVAEPVQTLDIPTGKDRTVYFAVTTADSEGVAALKLTAAGNGESSSAGTELLVRSPLPAVSRIASGVNAGDSVPLEAESAKGFLPGTVRRDLRLGRYPLVRYSGKLEYLLGYPYGCIEQTVSRAFPLLYFANLAKELEPEALAKSSPEAMVQQGISRALSMQLPSGGFGMWPGSENEQRWGTVYATHFLLEASRAGYQVSPQALAQALANLAEEVKEVHLGSTVKTQAYGLYVLALAGKPDRGQMDHLRGKAAGLPGDARALLAAAYVASGNAKGGEGIAVNLGQPQPAPRSDDIFDSPLRCVALELAALATAAPAAQETANVARELTKLLDSAPYCSTQETGMAFMALGKLFAKQQGEPACTGQVMAGSTPVASFSTAKITVLRALAGDGPVSVALEPGCKPGSLYYTLDVRGIPEAASYKASSQGIEIKREFLDRDGKPLDVSRLPSGKPVVIRTSVRSVSGPLKHVALSQLMPPGLEVENPRLATTDKLPWMEEPAETSYADYRADRVNVFLDLDGQKWSEVYTLCRTVIPGEYALPPAQAESMYYPEIRAGTEMGRMTVEGGQAGK